MRKIFFVIILSMCFASSYAQQPDWDPTKPNPAGSYDSFQKNNTANKRGLQLSAIFSQPNNYTVIVNGNVLRVGDSIEGYKVTEISKNSVTLTSKTNESFVLKFSDFNFKQLHQ